jgi:hypothetical protein
LIDRFFWISRCPVPNVRPIALSDSPRDSDPITAFLGRRKPSTKALRRPVETTLELDIVRRKSALRIRQEAPEARLDKAQRVEDVRFNSDGSGQQESAQARPAKVQANSI